MIWAIKQCVNFTGRGISFFVKINGQIMESMDYKGNNSFEGGLGQAKVKFDFPADGSIKVKVDYVIDNTGKTTTVEGTKLLKYS